MERKCICFSRVSTIQQDVVQQTKVLQNEAKRLGYSDKNQIVIEYQESGIKLDMTQRLGIQKLKETIINDNSVDCVICWELTRIARRADIIYNIRDFLIEHKIRWIICKPWMEIIDTNGKLTQMSSLILGIFTSFAESEMDIKKERFIRAKKEMKEHGQKFGGAVIFGYMKDKNKKCIPDPIKSKIVVDLFNHYVDNDSSLYETYTYACGKWPETFKVLEYKKAQHKIRHLFDIPVYYTGNWCYPPLISEELWDKVHESCSIKTCNCTSICKMGNRSW